MIWLLVMTATSKGTERAKSVCSEVTNSTSPLTLKTEFSSEVVLNEFIVKFTGFYEENARANFIEAALTSTGLDPGLSYEILPRNNPMAAYPSDFDVLQVSEDVGEVALKALQSHPLVKSITPQRKVTRGLREVEEDDDLTDAEVEEVLKEVLLETEEKEDKGKFSKGRRSLTFKPTFWNSVGRHTSRRLLRALPRQITAILQADILWEMGVTGRGVKVAVFDTGLSKTHPHFRRIRERTNWTNEKSLDDGLGHGTFVAGVIASSKECLGFAPDAEIHVFRVFTNSQVSGG